MPPGRIACHAALCFAIERTDSRHGRWILRILRRSDSGRSTAIEPASPREMAAYWTTLRGLAVNSAMVALSGLTAVS